MLGPEVNIWAVIRDWILRTTGGKTTAELEGVPTRPVGACWYRSCEILKGLKEVCFLCIFLVFCIFCLFLLSEANLQLQ